MAYAQWTIRARIFSRRPAAKFRRAALTHPTVFAIIEDLDRQPLRARISPFSACARRSATRVRFMLTVCFLFVFCLFPNCSQESLK
jgi:hypothetical protein